MIVSWDDWNVRVNESANKVDIYSTLGGEKTTGDDSDDWGGSELSGEGIWDIDGLVKLLGHRPLLKTEIVTK